MKRFHVHVGVRDLEQSIEFYSTLFASEPSVRKTDYAKWMLDDPRVNFAISARANTLGINHLGLQVDDAEELVALRGQLERADRGLVEQTGTTCCYAKSDKYWVADPQGVIWESFHSLATAPIYGERDDATFARSSEAGTCCKPGACGDTQVQGAVCC